MSLSSSFFSSDILFRALKKSCISLSKSFFLHVVALLLFLLRHSFSSAQEVLHLFVKVLLLPLFSCKNLSLVSLLRVIKEFSQFLFQLWSLSFSEEVQHHPAWSSPSSSIVDNHATFPLHLLGFLEEVQHHLPAHRLPGAT